MSFNIFSMLQYFIDGKTPNLNYMTARDYRERLAIIALSLFEWEGLPEGCNARHLEKTLYTHGQALFYKDNELGFGNAKCTPFGKLNHYDEPVAYTAFSTTYRKTFDADKCILIRNNLLERPTEHSVMLFASRLTEAERTIDVNIRAQKTPYFITCDDKDRLSFVNLMKKIDDNETRIFGSKSLDLTKLQVLKTAAPFIANELQEYKHDIWNEALTFFGVNNNSNQDKKERQITDEVNANNEVIQLNAQAMLLTRQKACEKINEMYGLNVSVKMRNFKENEGGEVVNNG